jgi:hypothetical protein
MKLIPYDSKEAAEEANQSKLKAYNEANTNVFADYFTEVIEHEGKFNLLYDDYLDNYFTKQEKSRLITVSQNSTND